MDQRTSASPEVIAEKRAPKNSFSKILYYYFRPIISRIIYQINLRKWSHHADSRILNWGWENINFNRIAVINLLLRRYENPSYLEIGCASDGLFNSIPIDNKTGVDPLSGGNVRMSSDDFFKLNQAKFDVVFIDGLHTYEQVRRDIINSIQSLNYGGWIALHDMLPRNWVEQHTPIISRGAWTGDVWKVAFELIQTEGIEFKILKLDHGVGVIKVLEPGVVLKDFRSEMIGKEFSFLYDNLNKLPITEWSSAKNWLRS